jgi:hypothetical protein
MMLMIQVVLILIELLSKQSMKSDPKDYDVGISLAYHLGGLITTIFLSGKML